MTRCVSPWRDGDLEIAQWISSCFQHLMGQHSRIHYRPEHFFLRGGGDVPVEIAEEYWLRCFKEGKNWGVSNQSVLPPPSSAPFFCPLASTGKALASTLPSCCLLAASKLPPQGLSCSSYKYLSSPHPNIIPSSITSKFPLFFPPNVEISISCWESSLIQLIHIKVFCFCFSH